MTISRGRTPRNRSAELATKPPARHLPRGQGRGRPPKAHLITLPDPAGMGIPLDCPFRLLVLSLGVSRMWAVPLLTRPLAAVRSRVPPGRAHPPALQPVSNFLFDLIVLTRPRSGPFPTSYLII